MVKDIFPQSVIEIARDLCLFVEDKETVDGNVTGIVFGVSASVVSVRLFLCKPNLTDLEQRSDELYDFVKKKGAKNLFVKVFSEGVKHIVSYEIEEEEGKLIKSVSHNEDNAAEGWLLRVEMKDCNDCLLEEKDDFVESVGWDVRTMLCDDYNRGIFLNGERLCI